MYFVKTGVRVTLLAMIYLMSQSIKGLGCMI
jgi:hypothetical protein